MKVCYFIQSHDKPEQVCRLARTIKKSSPNCHVLISHDFSTSYLDVDLLSGLSGVYLIRREKAPKRGSYDTFQVFLDAIDWLFKNNYEFDWFVFLSGADYPTQHLSNFENFLNNTDYDGFINHWKAGPWHPHNRGFKRYFYQYQFPLPEYTHWLAKKVSRLNDLQSLIHIYTGCNKQIGIRSTSHPFNDNFICYGNISWSILSRNCIQYLRAFLANNPEIVAYYKNTIIPDESVIATVLANNPSFKLCNDDKRYYIPTTGGGNGGYFKNLTIEDYPALTSDNYFFARKFKPNSEVLDLLDAKIFKAEVMQLSRL